MPEVHFRVKWPNGEEEECYSSSTVIEQYLEPGGSYEVADFVERATLALNLASERVRAKYGYACSSAQDQLGTLLRRASALSDSERSRRVEILSLARAHARG